MHRSLCALVLAGCAAGRSYVRVDDVALGRIVVYRNGVAFFERAATVGKGQGELQVMVPGDKVDDFLKSLTVVDRATGKPLGVSFPHVPEAGSGTVRMTILLPDAEPHELVLTYVTDAPAWKPSYRVEVGDEGKVTLQGWAIVDNTSAEDWKDVRLGVGSTAAISFRYDLWSIRAVDRQTLSAEERFSQAPPMGGSPYTRAPDPRVVMGTIEEDYLHRIPPAHSGNTNESVVIQDHAPTLDPGSTSQGTTFPADWTRMMDLAARIRQGRRVVVIQGFAGDRDGDPARESLARAHTLRNALIDFGVPPAQLQAEGRGRVAGQPAGVRLLVSDVELDRGPAPASAPGSDAPVGESHFLSERPVTVPRSTSIMLSTIRETTEGKVVYLYDPESPRGDQRFAFQAIRFLNPTGSMLDTGPLVVYGSGRFIGEGLSEPILAHASAIVPFALDRQIVVERSESTEDRVARPLALERGIMTAEIDHVRRIRFAATNRGNGPATVYLRHSVAPGWTLVKHPGPDERLGDAHLFAVELGGGQTRSVELEETTPVQRTVDLRSLEGRELISAYVAAESADPKLAGALRAMLALHRALVDETERLTAVRARLADLRVRLGELHAQLASLGEAKTRGALMTHLGGRMREVSERVQKATFEESELRDRVGLAEARFRDALVEVTLGR